MMNVKKCLTAAVMIAAGTLGFSLPGVVSPIPDTSGEYVFYEDKTFNRESIVGFLYYREASYAIRYYAPATESEKEKDITLYISVNPDNPVLELTGETFRGADAGDADLSGDWRDRVPFRRDGRGVQPSIHKFQSSDPSDGDDPQQHPRRRRRDLRRPGAGDPGPGIFDVRHPGGSGAQIGRAHV